MVRDKFAFFYMPLLSKYVGYNPALQAGGQSAGQEIPCLIYNMRFFTKYTRSIADADYKSHKSISNVKPWCTFILQSLL